MLTAAGMLRVVDMLRLLLVLLLGLGLVLLWAVQAGQQACVGWHAGASEGAGLHWGLAVHGWSPSLCCQPVFAHPVAPEGEQVVTRW